MRLEIIHLVTGHRDVDGAGIMRTDLDGIDLCAAKVFRRDIGPAVAVVPCQLQQAVVRAYVNRAGLVPRLRNVENRAVEFRADVLRCQRAAVQALLADVVFREIRADFGPRDAPVGTSEQDLRTVVQDPRIVRRRRNRCVPVRSVFQVFGLLAEYVFRVGFDRPDEFRLVVVLRQRAVDRRRINQAGIVRIECNVRTLTATDRVVILDADATVESPAGDRNRRIVLLAAIQAIGCQIVDTDPVELRRGLVHDARPGLAAIERDRGTAVIGIDHVEVVFRIDPVIVMVAVRCRLLFEGHAAVDRLHDGRVEHPDRVGIDRIRLDVNVIPGARPEDSVAVHELPGLAVIVAAVQPALVQLGLDNGVNAVRHAGRDIHAGLADQLGQTARQLFPGVTAVGGLENAAGGATGFDEPWLAPVLPHRRVHDARIGRVHRQIGGAGLVVDLQDGLPGVAAILAAVHATLFAGPPDLSLDGNVHEIGVFGMDDNPGDLPRLRQADVLPGRTGIGRFVHAVAVTGRDTTDRRLARADVNDVDVGLGHGDRTDRADVEVVVGYVLPGNAGIFRLPDSTARGAHVIEPIVSRDSRNRSDPAAAPGPDQAPFEAIQQRRID